MAIKKGHNNYIKMRKKLLKEHMDLIYEREKLNKKIRAINKSMNEWDKALLSEE